MSTHQKEHCKVPNHGQNKKARVLEGMLWACDCGKVYRYTSNSLVSTVNNKMYYEWQEFDYYSK